MDRKKAHVYVTLYGNNGQKLRVKSLVDTGNTIQEETAVTEAIHNKLNVGCLVSGTNTEYQVISSTPKLADLV